MSLIDDAVIILKDAGFRISDRKPKEQALFEDDTVMGLVIAYPDAKALLADWQLEQDRFLAECASQIRRAPTKAWNMYTVHLTASSAGLADVGVLSKVEEDFRATRKIAKVAITREEVLQALLPLLPLQSYASGMVEGLPERLRRTLRLRPESVEAILSSPPDEIAMRLLEEP
jgi:hypothetical protein